MTREEAIKALEHIYNYVGIHYINGVEDPYINPHLKEAVKVALSALRPVSRETVEKVWRGEWKLCGAVRGRGGIWRCTRCEDIYPYKNDFCPKCGAPMTGKAVEMMMERMEALNDG